MTNQQIARDVMGWTAKREWHGYNYFDESNKEQFCTDFLNDHNAAMMVVEKMREEGYYPKSWTESGDWVYAFFSSAFECEGLSHNESLCHTICEAALKAKGETL